MTRILIADDHTLVREGLRQLLAEAFPNAELGEVGTTEETLAQLRSNPWNVLLLDIFMPGRSGLEVLEEVRRHWPRLAVLVLSSAPEEQLAVRVLKLGAAGYLNKRVAAEQLVQAVKKVRAGGRYIGADLAEKLAAEISGGSILPHEKLSGREFEVMGLIVAGRTLKEIAVELSLSVKTVSTFHTRIWEKLHVQNDVAVVRYAVEHGLTECQVFPPPAPVEPPPRPRRRA